MTLGFAFTRAHGLSRTALAPPPRPPHGPRGHSPLALPLSWLTAPPTALLTRAHGACSRSRPSPFPPPSHAHAATPRLLCLSLGPRPRLASVLRALCPGLTPLTFSRLTAASPATHGSALTAAVHCAYLPHGARPLILATRPCPPPLSRHAHGPAHYYTAHLFLPHGSRPLPRTPLHADVHYCSWPTPPRSHVSRPRLAPTAIARSISLLSLTVHAPSTTRMACPPPATLAHTHASHALAPAFTGLGSYALALAFAGPHRLLGWSHASAIAFACSPPLGSALIRPCAPFYLATSRTPSHSPSRPLLGPHPALSALLPVLAVTSQQRV